MSRWYDSSEGPTTPGNRAGDWPSGWLRGEWKCPECGATIGRSLCGRVPYDIVAAHERARHKNKETRNEQE